MDPHEVIMRVVQRNGRLEIRQLLAERIGQAGKSPVFHAHGKILALNKTCRNVLRIRIAYKYLLLAPDHFRRRVASATGVRLGCEHFEQLRVVNLRIERAADRTVVRGKRIGRNLRPVSGELANYRLPQHQQFATHRWIRTPETL